MVAAAFQGQILIRAELARRVRALLSGSPDGVPEWTPLVEGGDDIGLFGPEDAPWVVHADIATMIGGIRALLMQAMHPGSLAGVAQHSRYENDVLGRLAGTIRWLTITTFGSEWAIAEESARVRGMHDRVRGKYQTADGERSYRASDPDLLMWVHIAFTDSFLTSHLRYGQHPIPGGPDAYVGQWGKSVIPLGLEHPPASEAELRQLIVDFEPALRVDDRTLRVVKFLRNPPLPRGAKPAYWLMSQAAIATLPTSYRQQLQLRALPEWLVFPVVRALMSVMRYIMGSTSPLEEAAMSRRARLAASQSAN